MPVRSRPCPRCGAYDLRVSRTGRRWLRLLARTIFLRRVTCTSCGARFWRFALRA